MRRPIGASSMPARPRNFLDLQSSIELFTPIYQLLLTDSDFWRATNSLQLDETIVNQWTISSYVDTLIPLILGTGLAFQLPLVMFFLSKIGIVTPAWLRSVRKYAIVIIVIVAGIITPPDVISQIVVSLPLLILYEVSIWLSARVQKEKALEEAKEWS